MIYQDIDIRFLAKVWMNQLTTIDLSGFRTLQSVNIQLLG